MIYLIGGPPKCGKTTLAKSLSKKTGISWMSADTIQNIVKIHTPESDHFLKFPSSSHRASTNDERFSKYSTKKLIDDYIQQAKSSYSGIRMIVETYLVDEDDFIVEGYQITPELVNALQKEFGTEKVKTVFLIKTDEEKFISNIHQTSTPNDWIIRRTVKEVTYSKIARMIAQYSVLFEKEAQRYKLPVLSMDERFEAQLEKAQAILGL